LDFNNLVRLRVFGKGWCCENRLASFFRR
jgi:hypothetical protein